MKKLNKSFYAFSILAHILCIIILLAINTSNKITSNFIVFGAHSKRPTQAYFKALKQTKTSNTDWLKKRNIKQPKPKQPIKKNTPPPKPKSPEKKVNPTTAIKKPVQKIIKKVENKPIKKKELPQKPANIEKVEKEEEFHFNLLQEINDPRLLEYQKHIQKEVDRLWRPPIGVPKGTECSLTFIIDSKGKVEKSEITERSNVLIYDLSALRIAKNFNLDKSLWNKKFTIVFRQ